MLDRLNNICKKENLPLLIEADGSRQRPLKAPAAHEPPIPEFSELVVVLAGLSGLGKPNTESFVHRPEIFGRITGLEQGERISEEAIESVLRHPEGGLKSIPAQARRVALLNQAETPELLSAGGRLATSLSGVYHSVLVGSLHEQRFQTFERTAGIILAAGGSQRLGRPKQLLDWRGEPFVRAVARTALAAGLSPVLVVTGAHGDQTEAALYSLPVQAVHNPGWQEGQASSIRAGLQALTGNENLPGWARPFSCSWINRRSMCRYYRH